MDGFAALARVLQTIGGALLDGVWPGSLAVAVGVVFASSALAKAGSPSRTAVAIADFGVVARPRVAAGVALVAAEMLLAGLLLSGWGAHLVLPAVVVVCVTFVFVILRSLVRHASFSCFCFGDEHETLSGATLARALVLTAVAATATVGVYRQTAATTVAWSGDEYVIGLSLVGSVALIGSLRRLITLNALHDLARPVL